MADPKKLLTRIQPSQYGFIRDLADAGLVDLAKVEDLITEAVADRMRLSEEYLAFAKSLDETQPVHQKRIISACYYGQYHAARALVLFQDKADRDDHKSLPKDLERVLPGRGVGKTLTTWRDNRRSVDYDCYIELDSKTESIRALTDTVPNAVQLSRK